MTTGDDAYSSTVMIQGLDVQGLEPSVVEELMRMNNELVNSKRQLQKKHALLSKQEARFRRIIQDNPDPVFVVDSEYRVLFMSNAAEELANHYHTLGIATGKLLPFSSPHSGELVVSQEPGPYHVFDKSEMKTTWDNEEAVIVFLRQVTERKQAEISLMDERNFIEAILQTVNSLVVVLDINGRVVRFNHACEQVSGFSIDEMKDRSLWDVLLHPADVKKVKLSLERVLTAGKEERNETLWVSKAGDTRLIAWHYSPMSRNGKGVEHVIATGTDITEMREIENQGVRELASLEDLSSPIQSRTTAATLGASSLRDSAPSQFHRQVEQFAQLLNMSLDMLHFKVDHDVPRKIEHLSQELGTLLAGPRDITDLFLEAFKQNSAGATPEKSRAYRAEGRILLIEILGKLVQHYRNHCLSGLPRIRNEQFWNKEKSK